MTFLDEATHLTVVDFLQFEDQALKCLKNYVNTFERETNCKIENLRSDNCGEYILKEWGKYCQYTGIKHSMGTAH